VRAKRLFVTLLLLVPTLTVRAGDQTLLIELERSSSAYPNAVSASGAVVVGGLGTGGGFYWMPTTGTVFIGGLGATSVSRDGRTIVGQVVDSRVTQAAIWIRGAEWKPLGSFTPTAAPCDTSLSLATDTSADGRVVVGYARDGCNISHAFRWEESTGMVDLGSSVAGRNSFANGVSPDGTVVVGYQEAATGFQQGARWVDGRQELFTGPGGPVGHATATNYDGTIVVGRTCNGAARPTEPGFQSAWIWTAHDGLQCLPAPAPIVSPGPPINVEANGVSDDGRVIVGGQGIGADDVDAIIWIDRVPHYLKDYLRANGVPNAFATYIKTGSIADVSPDGRILVARGAPLGGFRGYIVIFGEKP
jgi:probable HAF family extracellular repeat protein